MEQNSLRFVFLAALRGAIETLLTKRRMDFHLLKGKGSFLVNAASGFVLYEPSQQTDTKVTVAQPSASGFTDAPNRIRRSLLEQQLSENRGESRKALKKQFYNIRNEGAAFDEAVSKSLKEKERTKEENKKQKDLLEEAMKLSLAEKQKEAEEEEKLCAAIELSKKESIVNAMDEDEQIRKLMALSKAEFDQQYDPDVYLQQVIELSRKEEDNHCALKNGEDLEDEGLLKALELSVVDFWTRILIVWEVQKLLTQRK